MSNHHPEAPLAHAAGQVRRDGEPAGLFWPYSEFLTGMRSPYGEELDGEVMGEELSSQSSG